MKSLSLFILVGIAITASAFTDVNNDPLPIGKSSKAMNMDVTNFKGENASLKSYAKKNGLIVIFSSNTCPFVIAWESRYPDLADYCKKNDIGFVLLNSNEARRAGEASLSEMEKHATEMKYDFQYLMDKDSRVADAFGAKATPQVYLFNNENNLVYRGAIDDNHKNESEVKHTYAMDALQNLVGGKEINPETTNALGCSIKRVK